MTVDKMVGWHHQLSGHDFEQTPGDSERQESLVCCSHFRVRHELATEQQWLLKNQIIPKLIMMKNSIFLYCPSNFNPYGDFHVFLYDVFPVVYLLISFGFYILFTFCDLCV